MNDTINPASDPYEASTLVYDNLQAIIAIADLVTAANPHELPDATLSQLGPHLRRLAVEASDQAEALWLHYRSAKGLAPAETDAA